MGSASSAGGVAAARWQQAAAGLPLVELRAMAEMGAEQWASLNAVQGQVRRSTTVPS